MQLVEDYCATICTFTNGNVYRCAKSEVQLVI